MHYRIGRSRPPASEPASVQYTASSCTGNLSSNGSLSQLGQRSSNPATAQTRQICIATLTLKTAWSKRCCTFPGLVRDHVESFVSKSSALSLTVTGDCAFPIRSRRCTLLELDAPMSLSRRTRPGFVRSITVPVSLSGYPQLLITRRAFTAVFVSFDELGQVRDSEANWSRYFCCQSLCSLVCGAVAAPNQSNFKTGLPV